MSNTKWSLQYVRRIDELSRIEFSLIWLTTLGRMLAALSSMSTGSSCLMSSILNWKPPCLKQNLFLRFSLCIKLHEMWSNIIDEPSKSHKCPWSPALNSVLSFMLKKWLVSSFACGSVATFYPLLSLVKRFWTGSKLLYIIHSVHTGNQLNVSRFCPNTNEITLPKTNVIQSWKTTSKSCSTYVLNSTRYVNSI